MRRAASPHGPSLPELWAPVTQEQTQADLPSIIVDKLEGAETKSAAVVRNMVYRLLTTAGVDVDKLRRDACLDRIEDLEARAARSKSKKSHYDELLEAEQKKLKVLSHVPKQELVRHKGEAPVIESFDENGHPLRADRRRWAWPVDKIRHCLPEEHYAAAARLRWAFEASQTGSKVADWQPGGRSDPARKLAITPTQELAGRDWHVMWTRCTGVVRLIAWNFVLEQAPRGHDRPLTAKEFGEQYGRTNNVHRAAGVTDGAIITTCAVLAEILRGHRAWQAEQEQRRPPRLTANERKMLDKWEQRR